MFDSSATRDNLLRFKIDYMQILSARDLKVRGVLCALLFVHVVDFSMSHGGRCECGMPTAPGLPLSVMLTGVCDSVDLASPSIKRNLNICQGTIDDAVAVLDYFKISQMQH